MSSQEALDEISPSRVIYGCPEGQDARALIAQARELMPQDLGIIHVALDDTRVATLQELIQFFGPDVSVITLPAWDCLPFDRVSPSTEIMSQRMNAFTHLIQWEGEQHRRPRILLTTVNAILQRAPPKKQLAHLSLNLKIGTHLNLEHLQTFLETNGYLRNETVREPGEYAIRGGIIDLFPSGYTDPLRIDLFGDEIETIKTFDAESQISLGKVREISLIPARETFLDDPSIHRFRSKYREIFGARRENDPLYESISSARRYNGMEHWLPLFYEHLDTIFDYAENFTLTLDDHASQAINERLLQIEDFYQSRKTLEASQTQKKSRDVSLSGATYHPLPPDYLYLPEKEWLGKSINAITFSPFGSPSENTTSLHAKKGRDFADIRAMPDSDVFAAFKDYIYGLKDRPVLIATYSQGAQERLRGMLENAGFSNLKEIKDLDQFKKIKSGQTGLCILHLSHGFIAPDLVVVTEQDLLGDRMQRRGKGRKKADNFLREVSSLNEGDLVVHLDHGIGRFAGLETLNAGGTLHDCLRITYAGGDKLFVPVENLDVLSRFGSDEGTTQLDKLGGAAWQARKARVKKDLMRMAGQLMEIAAKRSLQRSDPLELEPSQYQQFAARFPYQETDDQARSIDQVLEDLGKDHPMDRLVCGDVGFGKTEVAIRAAYVAAKAGAQVALVVPTTLLARQHFANFMERFDGTGLRLAQLSRMVGNKELAQVKQGLENGSIHIVVGTHALFSKDVKFAHLGLVIVDEEQRFGVKQKERLKEFKQNVHVLTMTATPIPRTLQMSLSGVRDLSLITTPPVDRLAIRTFVLPFDPVIIREALLRESYRGGQTFYVCPRIKDMPELQEQLKELVPEVSIISAHGQMNPTELDERMTAFYDGQYDVLLATNIIESGIDIPRANTMVIHRADMFGLAQLYQIRGRIGRSKVRAYAYLTYSPNKSLTKQGQKRLEVISTLDSLGAGFQLASHDMDIRGAGNLLGEEQSGHIREVGVELYQQMLEEAVAATREGIQDEEHMKDQAWSPQINLGTSVLIPEEYVPDLGVRMTLYRRISDLDIGSDVEQLAAELIDRFGPLPSEVENLLDIVKIKQLCKQAGVDRVEAGPKGMVIGFYQDAPPNLQGLVTWMADQRGTVKLRPDNKLAARREWHEPGLRVKGVRKLLGELVCIASQD